MPNPVQDVFNCIDLRKKILYFLIKPKYSYEVYTGIKTLMTDLIKDKWCFFCPCITCQVNSRSRLTQGI